MNLWVKKISKIHQAMSMLERQKNTAPNLTKSFNSLVQCLKSGFYARAMTQSVKSKDDKKRSS